MAITKKNDPRQSQSSWTAVIARITNPRQTELYWKWAWSIRSKEGERRRLRRIYINKSWMIWTWICDSLEWFLRRSVTKRMHEGMKTIRSERITDNRIRSYTFNSWRMLTIDWSVSIPRLECNATIEGKKWSTIEPIRYSWKAVNGG